LEFKPVRQLGLLAACVGEPDLFARYPVLVHACMASSYVDGSIKEVQMIGVPEVT